MNRKDKYMASLTEKEKTALEIARSHLGLLFTLEKTAGFLRWKSIQEKENKTTTLSK